VLRAAQYFLWIGHILKKNRARPVDLGTIGRSFRPRIKRIVSRAGMIGGRVFGVALAVQMPMATQIAATVMSTVAIRARREDTSRSTTRSLR